jgi:hypothetical protein
MRSGVMQLVTDWSHARGVPEFSVGRRLDGIVSLRMTVLVVSGGVSVSTPATFEEPHWGSDAAIAMPATATPHFKAVANGRVDSFFPAIDFCCRLFKFPPLKIL